MLLYCPNKECDNCVDTGTNSRYRPFMCRKCGFIFRGIHAFVNRKDFYWKFFFPYLSKWDVSYKFLIFTPCPFCWSDLTVYMVDGSDPPDTLCPTTCWSCQHDLPKDRIDVFHPNFLKAKIENHKPQTFENPSPEPEKTRKPVKAKKKRVKTGEEKRPEPLILNREQAKIFGPGVAILQRNFKDLAKKTHDKKDPINEVLQKFKDNLEDKISCRDAFDMARSLSMHQHMLDDKYDKILDLLVQDFEK